MQIINRYNILNIPERKWTILHILKVTASCSDFPDSSGQWIYCGALGHVQARTITVQACDELEKSTGL